MARVTSTQQVFCPFFSKQSLTLTCFHSVEPPFWGRDGGSWGIVAPHPPPPISSKTKVNFLRKHAPDPHRSFPPLPPPLRPNGFSVDKVSLNRGVPLVMPNTILQINNHFFKGRDQRLCPLQLFPESMSQKRGSNMSNKFI